MKKIGILTTFYCWNKAYSLTSVVEEQLLSLIEHGYSPVLFVHDNFEGNVPKGTEIRKIVPRFQLIDYHPGQNPESGFQEQVDKTAEAFKKHFADIDIIFTHDIIFQGWFLPYNAAIRRIANEVKCKWFHWIHSAPSGRSANLTPPHSFRYSLMPNSKLVYMNHTDSLSLAEMYGGTLNDVRVVYNPLDLRSFYNFSEFTCNLIKKYDLLSADIIQVYPVSSTRFSGKQVDKVLKIFAALKRNGKSVRFICANAHANAQREKNGIDHLIQQGIEFGLDRKEIIFTSLEDKKYELDLPHEIVRELFSISNLFVFPTLSENCPLILLEAAAAKCLLVLNESFPPLREFFTSDALYFKFASLRENVNYDNEDKYFDDIARIIIGQMTVNKPLSAFNKLRQRFNRDWIFKNQLEPMLFEEDDQRSIDS